MVSRGPDFDHGSGDEQVEQWVSQNMLGEASPTMEDYPSVYPVMEPKVNTIAVVAKDPSRGKDFDSELAQQMNQLNVRERERKFEEMHGVSSFTDETNEKVLEALFQIEQEIAAIPIKHAYDLAYSMDRRYVESRKFRLMFLRAELFDARKAAERLVLFLEKKLKFFGRATLVRSIQMGDLEDEDIQTLKAGPFQILPSRDRSGRPILFKCSNCGPKLYTSLLSYVSILLLLLLQPVIWSIGLSIHWRLILYVLLSFFRLILLLQFYDCCSAVAGGFAPLLPLRRMRKTKNGEQWY